MTAARARLADLAPDPSAGRAQRDHMIEALEGIDRWVPRPVRADLAALVERNAVSIGQLELAGTEPAHPLSQRALKRWSSTSPLQGSCRSSRARRELRVRHGGRAPARTTPARMLGRRTSPVLGIGLGWQRYGRLAYLLEWIEVIRPTRAQPLHALHVTVTDRSLLPSP
ncbi:hypothetical protein [Streptomyces sp. NBRC 110028]|uniref:hypothetical protein n=1 Tax=Streptomyces sp. NBRC 110028 TaxID=1621260 RepID=UPI00131E35D0|nr:hypothetical protein [Streptomyces sp. NBRC 110028]